MKRSFKVISDSSEGNAEGYNSESSDSHLPVNELKDKNEDGEEISTSIMSTHTEDRSRPKEPDDSVPIDDSFLSPISPEATALPSNVSLSSATVGKHPNYEMATPIKKNIVVEVSLSSVKAGKYESKSNVLSKENDKSRIPIEDIYGPGNHNYEIFMKELEDFRRKQNRKPTPRDAILGQVPVNLYKLDCLIYEHGGPYKVTQDKKWKEMLKELLPNETILNGPYLLKQLYARWLFDFDIEKGKYKAEDEGGRELLEMSTGDESGSFGTPMPRRNIAMPGSTLGHKSFKPILARPKVATSSLTPGSMAALATPLKPNPIHPSNPGFSLLKPGQSIPIQNGVKPIEARQINELYKLIVFEHFQGGAKSRIIKSLECGLPNEIEWAFCQLMNFSALIEAVFVQFQSSQNVNATSYGVNSQLQSLTNTIRILLAAGFLDRLLIHANPFFQILNAIWTLVESRTIINLNEFLLHEEIIKAVDSVLTSIEDEYVYGLRLGDIKIVGITDASLIQKEQRRILLKILLNRMLEIATILYRLTFLNIEELRSILHVKSFQLYLKKGCIFLKILSLIENRQDSESKLGRIAVSQLNYLFALEWDRLRNCQIEIIANLSPLMDIKVLGLEPLLNDYVTVLTFTNNKYYIVTCLETMTKWLGMEANVEMMIKHLHLSSLISPLMGRLMKLIILPDVDISQSVLDFFFVLFDSSQYYHLQVHDSILYRLVPLFFGLLYENLEFPVKSSLSKYYSTLGGNLYTPTMTNTQKTIKWVAVSYQPGLSPKEKITINDIYEQYLNFTIKEKIPKALTKQELHQLLIQIYPKCIPPKAEWPLDSDQNQCQWKDCTMSCNKQKDLQAHLYHSHLKDLIVNTEDEIPCEWRSCHFKVKNHHALLSHAMVHVTEEDVFSVDIPLQYTDSRGHGGIDVEPEAGTGITGEVVKATSPGTLRSPLLPVYYYLKARQINETPVRVNEKALQMIKILYFISKLTHVISDPLTLPPSHHLNGREEALKSKAMIMKTFAPHLERLCLYWSLSHQATGKYLPLMISQLKDIHEDWLEKSL